MRSGLSLAVTLLVSLARAGWTVPVSGDCVYEFSETNIAVNTEVRFPIPSSFRNCIPTPDPNAVRSSDIFLYLFIFSFFQLKFKKKNNNLKSRKEKKEERRKKVWYMET